MSTVSRRPALFFAAMLALAAVSGCADVRQNPASNVVNGQADAFAQQNAGPQHATPTNIPF